MIGPFKVRYRAGLMLVGGLFLLASRLESAAAFPSGEEIEFRFEPSFRDGVLVWLARTPDGKIHCSAYVLPVLDDGGMESHSKAQLKLLKETVVSAENFNALVSVIEGRELRDAAESNSIGLDGTRWTFRRKAGGRHVELCLWTPERNPNSPAVALGRRFVALAHIEGVLPKEEANCTVPPK